jgi:hypothetical protein
MEFLFPGRERAESKLSRDEYLFVKGKVSELGASNVEISFA